MIRHTVSSQVRIPVFVVPIATLVTVVGHGHERLAARSVYKVPGCSSR